jgi:periplasmic protein CpxP/Spy
MPRPRFVEPTAAKRLYKTLHRRQSPETAGSHVDGDGGCHGTPLDRRQSQAKESPMTDHQSNYGNPVPEMPPSSKPKRGRRWFLVTATALAAGLAGAVASQALSQDGPPWHRGGFVGGPFEMGGGPFHMGAPFDPARAAGRADRMVRHLAVEIDATPEQVEKLRAIVKDAVNELVPLRERAVSARERARTLLTGATIDRAAIEKFRADQVALADEASRRIAKALGDAAEVLSAEQRHKLDERIAEHRGRWRPWHRG